MPRKRGIYLPLLALVLVVMAGAALRLAGAGWGFPLLLHADERSVVQPAIHMLQERTLDPDFFKRPNHVSIYLSAAAYAAARPMLGDEPIEESYELHPTTYVLLSRLISGILGTLTILVAYLAGRKLSRGTGLLAALLFAFFPSYVLHAHYATPDVALTLLSLVVVLCAMSYIERPRWRPLLLGVVFAALAVIEKYPGLLASLPLLLAVAVAHRRAPGVLLRRMALVGLLYPLLVFAFSPYLLLRWGDVVSELQSEARSTHLGQDGFSWLGNLVFYASAYLELSGALLLAFLLVGLAAVIRRRQLVALPLLSSALYWLALSWLSLHWERWALPMYSAGLILSAHGIAVAGSWALHGRQGPPMAARRAEGRSMWRGSPVLLAAAVAIVSLALGGVGRSLLFTLPDTRTEASYYLAEQGVTKRNSLYDGYTPFLPSSTASLIEQRGKLEDEEVRYLVASSSMYLRYLEDAETYPEEAGFYSRALQLPLLKEFRPVQLPQSVGLELGDTARLGPVPFVELEAIRDTVSLLARRGRSAGEPMTGPLIGLYVLTPETRLSLARADERRAE